MYHMHVIYEKRHKRGIFSFLIADARHLSYAHTHHGDVDVSTIFANRIISRYSLAVKQHRDATFIK